MKSVVDIVKNLAEIDVGSNKESVEELFSIHEKLRGIVEDIYHNATDDDEVKEAMNYSEEKREYFQSIIDKSVLGLRSLADLLDKLSKEVEGDDTATAGLSVSAFFACNEAHRQTVLVYEDIDE